MAKNEEEEAACPVCGKDVGLEVPSCPHCGAEFEDEEIAEEVSGAAPVASSDEEDVSCPVCGAVVGLDISACPNCGAEFEEEEIEEIIEVQETQFFEETEPVPARARPPRERPRARPKPVASISMDLPASMMDLKVIGLALIALGILGTQVALMIDWYWSWVPPIEDNLGLFIAVPLVVLVVGLLVFMLVKKAVAGGKEMPSMMPSSSLAVFMVGIFALIVILLWSPINSALQDSQGAVAGGFALVLVVGVLLLFMSRRAPQRTAG